MTLCYPSHVHESCAGCVRYTAGDAREPAANRIAANGNSYHKPAWARRGIVIDGTVLQWTNGQCPMRVKK